MIIGRDWYTARPEFQSKLETLRNYIGSIEVEFPVETTYEGKRGAMIVDVITSKQRQYSTRVVKIVRDWADSVPEATLKELVANPQDKKLFGLREGESESITNVARGLLKFGVDFGIDDEDLICLIWATAVEKFRFAPKLDPYVGHVDGMGIALFAYMRKLSGDEAIKPDLRVRQRLQSMGFDVPEGPQALMLLCEILADELGIFRSSFDSYLWRDPSN